MNATVEARPDGSASARRHDPPIAPSIVVAVERGEIRERDGLARAVAELAVQRDDAGERDSGLVVAALRDIDPRELVAGYGFDVAVAQLAAQREDAGELDAGPVVVALRDIDPGKLVAGDGFAAAVAELAEQREDAGELGAGLVVVALRDIDPGEVWRVMASPRWSPSSRRSARTRVSSARASS